jgi:hypothetical protein
VTTQDVFVYDALKTPQFWLIWWILCLNVTAGIGVLGQATAMSQEMFRGQITAVMASGFVGLSACLIWWGAPSGRRLPTISAARTPISSSLPSARFSTRSHLLRRGWQHRPLRDLLRRHLQHVWRRVCHGASVSARHVRHRLCRGDPRIIADGLVDGRGLWSSGASSRPWSTPSRHFSRCALFQGTHLSRASSFCQYLTSTPIAPKLDGGLATRPSGSILTEENP